MVVPIIWWLGLQADTDSQQEFLEPIVGPPRWAFPWVLGIGSHSAITCCSVLGYKAKVLTRL